MKNSVYILKEIVSFFKAKNSLALLVLFFSLGLKAQFRTLSFERIPGGPALYEEVGLAAASEKDSIPSKAAKTERITARMLLGLEPRAKREKVKDSTARKAHFSLKNLPPVVQARTKLKEKWQAAKPWVIREKEAKKKQEVDSLVFAQKRDSLIQEARKKEALSLGKPSEERQREEREEVRSEENTEEVSLEKVELSTETLDALPEMGEVSKKQEETTLEKKRRVVPTLGFSLPHEGPLLITSPYGYRKHPISGKHHFHAGIDLKIAYKPVLAVLDGEVIKSGWDPKGGGYFLTLKHERGYETSYLHLSELYYGKGEKVRAGYVIAKSGSSGSSTAPHLHFAVKQKGKHVSPVEFLRKEWLKPSAQFLAKEP